MKMLAISGALLATTTVCAHAVPVSWTDWRADAYEGGVRSIVGQATGAGGTAEVRRSNTRNAVYFRSFGTVPSETDYWANQRRNGSEPLRDDAVSPYTSVGPNGVDNAPTGKDIIGLAMPGIQTVAFSGPVTDIYLSFVSLEGDLLRFGQEFEILSSAGESLDGQGVDKCGLHGCGTLTKAGGPGNRTLSPTGSGHGTILFRGVFDSFSWNLATAWSGFTLGVGQVGAAPSAVPLPAAGLLLAGSG